MPPRVTFDPPLLNTSSAFSSTLEQLKELYYCPHTGAVTTRTALLNEGFHETPEQHKHLFFRAPLSDPLVSSDVGIGTGEGISAFNTYGYSPYPLAFYLSAIELLVPKPNKKGQTKPFIISVAGTPSEIAEAVDRISKFASRTSIKVLVELNLSCPNITGSAPAGYSASSIKAYVDALPDSIEGVPVGFKNPPYTYAQQMRDLLDALESRPAAVSFITATNTLGNCLYMPPNRSLHPATAAYMSGAMSGAMIHPLALGNVFSLRNMLDERPAIADIAIIGAGGVVDRAGFERMRSVGAEAVGVATVLGYRGVEGLVELLPVESLV